MSARDTLPRLVRSRSRCTALLLALLAAAALAGCGGDDNDGSATAMIDFQEQVNRICKQSSDASKKEARAVVQDKKLIKLKLAERNAEAISRLSDASRPYYDKLRELDPPKDFEADYKAYIGRLGETFRRLDEVEAAYRKADIERVSDLNKRIAEIGKGTAAFADKYGLRSCKAAEPARAPATAG